MYTSSIQDDPYADALAAAEDERRALNDAKCDAWYEGWRAGSRIGAVPTNPYARFD